LIFRLVKHGKCRENPNNRAGDSVGRTSYGFE
jgi:hypothetical protein